MEFPPALTSTPLDIPCLQCPTPPVCKDSYNYRIEQLEEDSGIASAYGIKKSLYLNDLNYFHAIEGLPFDIAHDVFEHLAVVVVISDALHVLVKEKCLTLQKISISRYTFKQSNPDKAIKQQPIKIIFGSNFKLKETACEMWNLIIILPLMLSELIIEENNGVCIYVIKVSILVEIFCASSVSK